jgi:hypothetical protein
MKQYHIGFDFGTYQSKACIFDISNSTHEFVMFDNNSFFLPSRVVRTENDLFVYGSMNAVSIKEEYRYFKIASAEDPEFRVETFGQHSDNSSYFYKFIDIINYTPEFLSVVYITYALFYIKEKYSHPKIEEDIKPSFISRLLKRNKSEEDVRFTVQIGIPTEWSHIKNLRRKRKFENILLLSELLQKEYLNLTDYLSTPTAKIIEDIKTIYGSFNFKRSEEFSEKLNEAGASVYPETAAGLTFILQTQLLPEGYYAILDIGGGTSDISFFRISANGTLKYLASESYMMAANNVYRQYYGSCETMAALKKAEDEVQRILDEGKWKENVKLSNALKHVDKQLNSALYKLFNQRVYYYRNDMVSKYCNQPIILYGGGARIPLINSGSVKIHDNGCNSLNIDHTCLEKKTIEDFAYGVELKPYDQSWKPDFGLLVVSLGLSYIKPESSAVWFDQSEYNWKDGNNPTLVPHPFNEDYYIYDVLNSRFN